MCFVSQSLRSAATVCLCLQTGTFGLSPHTILAALFRGKKIKSSSIAVLFVRRQKNFFVRAQLYTERVNVNARVNELIQHCMKKENSSDHLAQNNFKLDREDSLSL